jgi:hypothetical protein
MQDYLKTGLYDFIPGIDSDKYESETDLHEAVKRKNKLHQTNFIVPPRNVISQLHKRTYFQGSTGVAQGVGILRIDDRRFNEDFIQAKKCIKKDRKKAAHES